MHGESPIAGRSESLKERLWPRNDIDSARMVCATPIIAIDVDD